MKKRTAAVYLALAATLLACGDDDEPTDPTEFDAARESLNRGWVAYDRGDYSVALIEFERAANTDDSLADAHNGVGWTRLNLVDSAVSADVLNLAVEAFNRSLRANGDHADAWVGMGEALFLRRKDAKDLRDAANALASARSAPSDSLYRHDYSTEAQVRALEAWCRYYAGDPSTARSLASSALELESDLNAARVLIDLIPF